ncbi:MAG: protein kinase [Verrucomicrobiota bacterium]
MVKCCRYSLTTRQRRERRRVGRFLREINAMEKARDSLFAGCVLAIIDKGAIDLRSEYGKQRIHYYVMTEADYDLRHFLEQNEIDLPQKLHLCESILGHLRDLHALGIYHRDIKPENIFMIDGKPVLGDLGLINYRGKDQDMDDFDEKIGPLGFLSPEATNKCLANRGRPSFGFDCWIDDKSDIFQLGQLFWFILQDEVPTGHLSTEDARFTHPRLLSEVIVPMLQYGKQRRASVTSVGAAMAPILKEFALT